MITQETLISINKKFSNGIIVNRESLDIALSSPEKAWMDQVVGIVKSLLVDNIFEDGNKRTAAVIIAAYYFEFEIDFDAQRIDEIVVEIESRDIADIDKIKELIKSVIK